MTALQTLLSQFRQQSQTVRDQGTAFEHLMVDYFQNEPCYRDLYRQVLPYSRWVETVRDELDLNSQIDTGIVFVASNFNEENKKIKKKNNDDEYT